MTDIRLPPRITVYGKASARNLPIVEFFTIPGMLQCCVNSGTTLPSIIYPTVALITTRQSISPHDLQDAMTISCCFWNSPLVSFWFGLAGAPCRRKSRLKAAPTARFFAMIGFTQAQVRYHLHVALGLVLIVHTRSYRLGKIATSPAIRIPVNIHPIPCHPCSWHKAPVFTISPECTCHPRS